MNNTKVCLMIVYNHRFDKNISRLEELYKGKFSHIYHIMPFYDGDKENVIPVYEHSYYFSGYIAQAYLHLKNKGFTHYFVVADDMVLNPKIDEHTLWKETGIAPDESYTPYFREYPKMNEYWDSIRDAMAYRICKKGVEIKNMLPSEEDAKKMFEANNVSFGSIPWKVLFKNSWKDKQRILMSFFHQLPFRLKRTPEYPLIGGYADIFLITEDVMPKFCQYMGIFAAGDLFVEVAMPTALVLTTTKIKHGNMIKLKHGDLWNDKEKEELLGKYNNSLSMLLDEYPEDYFFIHPIKLSKWK